MLAFKLRVAPFANAVLVKIIDVHKESHQTADESTISMLYKEQQTAFPIHKLFVDQAAHYADEEAFSEYKNLDFVKKVAQRLVSIREKQCRKPQPQSYFIENITEPEPDEEDDDCCIIIGIRSAPNGRPAPPVVENERSDTNEA